MPTISDRSKAMRIRNKVRSKAPVSAEEAGWLAEYEKATAEGRGEKVYGASAAASREVTYTEKETAAQSVGTGSAAEIAASAAMVREEGRRLDSIVDRGINALVRAVEAYEKMTAALLKERQADAQTHRALLDSLRSHFLARSEAESDLIRFKAEADAANSEGDDNNNAIETMAVKALLEKFAGGATEPTNVTNRKEK